MQVLAELQERSEAAEAAKGGAVPAQELEELRMEYEQRIAAAERKASACSLDGPHINVQLPTGQGLCRRQIAGAAHDVAAVTYRAGVCLDQGA
jgi:hypothetical protein